MTSALPDLTDCDREPIRIPGSIQPFGILLVLDESGRVVQAAGDVAARLGAADWLARPVADLVGQSLAQDLERLAGSTARSGFVAQWTAASGEVFDVSAHPSGDRLLVELEPGPQSHRPAVVLVGEMERAALAFERAGNLQSLCERAALEFRRITGFDRVMIYRCPDNEPGRVLAEDRAPELPSFLNHHFPASDIPRQARELYLRNLIRVIPDVTYVPAPVLPAMPEEPPLDMSDCALRSVSPIHLRYLQNMGVGASASVSIVVDGALWGLVACHNGVPKRISYEARAACRALAGGLGRQIKMRLDAEAYRERLRLYAVEDDLVAGLTRDTGPDLGLGHHIDDIRKMLDADGVAIIRGAEHRTLGSCPPADALAPLASWAVERSTAQVFATSALSAVYPDAQSYTRAVSGLLAITISTDEPFTILWFRAEAIEVLNWAGNPHQAVAMTAGEKLTPRASFEAWSETVRGTGRAWTNVEIESAGRLRQALLDLRQRRRLHALNSRLAETVADNEILLGQKEVLLREVNHRVQNSLFLVSSFLALQKREFADPALQAILDEAQRRIRAVGLVHRRLYRGDQVETIDLDRYLSEMREEMVESMGPQWERHLTVDAAPTLVSTDKAVSIGLVVTELVINANKYAYGGGEGPITIALREDSKSIRLSVSDHGRGTKKVTGGFGSRMMESLVRQLGGRLEYHDNDPGLRAVLTAPLGA